MVSFENTCKVVVGGPTNVIDRVDHSAGKGPLPCDVHKVIGETAVSRTKKGSTSEMPFSEEHKKTRDPPDDGAHDVTNSDKRANGRILSGGLVL